MNDEKRGIRRGLLKRPGPAKDDVAEAAGLFDRFIEACEDSAPVEGAAGGIPTGQTRRGWGFEDAWTAVINMGERLKELSGQIRETSQEIREIAGVMEREAAGSGLEEDRKYRFVWDETMGDGPEFSRPALRPDACRLFQFSLRDVLERRHGTDGAEGLFREAGALAGREFCQKRLAGARNLEELCGVVGAFFRELRIGLFRVEAAEGFAGEGDSGKRRLVVTVDEDLDYSGPPDTRELVCVYKEGFIRGILERFTGEDFSVREIDCSRRGARTCRFEAESF